MGFDGAGLMSVRGRRFGLVAVGLALSVVVSALPQHPTSAAARAPQASAAAPAKRAADARPTVKAAKPDPDSLADRVKADVADVPGPATYAYDAAGHLVGVTHDGGQTARYRYDPAGNLLGVDRFDSSALSVLSVVPVSARPGDSLTVHGTGFSATASSDHVTINGTAATVTSATATSLKVTVPSGVTAGPVAVSVGSDSATGEGFTPAAAAPVVTGMSPTNGPPSTQVTLTGSGFDANLPGDVVSVNGVRAEVSVVTASSLTFTVPAGATSGAVQVSTAAGTAHAADDFMIPLPGVDAASIQSTVRLAVGGTPQNVAVTSAGKSALVLFDAPASREVDIGLTGLTFTSRLTVAVYDTRGRKIRAIDLFAPDSVHLTRLTAGATYQLLISPSSATDTGQMLVTLSEPVTGTLSTTGPAVPANLSRAGQSERLTFSGTKDDPVSLGFAFTGFPNRVIMNVLAPDGSTIHDEYTYDTVWNIDFPKLPQDGTYTLVMEPYGGGTGQTSVTLSTPVTAGLTSTGATVNANITRAGQDERLTFSGTKDSLVNLGFAISGFSDYVVVHALAPDGTDIHDENLSNRPSDIDLPKLPQDGTYTVVMDPHRAGTGQTGVTLSTRLAAGELSLGGSGVTSVISRAGQDAAYTFTGTAGQTLSLNVSGKSTFSDYLNLDIIGPDGTNLGSRRSVFSDQSVAVPDLPSAGTYTVVIDPNSGATGQVTLQLVTRTAPAMRSAGRAVAKAEPAAQAVVGSVAGEKPAGGPASWQPDKASLRGLDWNVRRGYPKPAKPLAAPAGSTGLAGQVRTIDGKPLPRVSVSLGSVSARTAADGRFVLAALPSGPQTLVVDGRSASRKGHRYGLFRIQVTLAAGRTTALPYTIWMQQLDTQHMVRFPAPTTKETVLTTPKIPGLEVRIPAGSVIRDDKGKVVHELGITPIPVDRPPFPLPENGIVPVFFTVQPGGTQIFPQGAQIIYPNYTHLPVGTRVNFWDYDPVRRGWHVYGHGQVSANGTQVVPDPGTRVWAFNGTMFNTDLLPPWATKRLKDVADWLTGDPVDTSTGLVSDTHTDLAVDDTIPISVTRSLWQGDANAREFGIGQVSSYGMFLHSEQQYTEVDLYLPGGAVVHYVRTSSGTGYLDAVFEARNSPSEFRKSTISYDNNAWDLRLRDGTTYTFPLYGPLSSIRDRLGNEVTLTRSNGTTGDLTQITSPNGKWIKLGYDTSHRVIQARDNIGRTVGYTYLNGRLDTVTNPDGKITHYGYDASGRLATIKDPRNITYLTNTYDTAGRVKTQTLTDGQVYSFAYTTDSNGHVTQTDVTQPGGAVRRVTFNTDGALTSDTDAQGSTLSRTTTYQRGTDNRIDSVTDPFGRRTDVHYDSSGRPTYLTRLAGTADAADGPVTTYEDIFDLPVKVTDQFGKSTTFDYDGDGNLRTVTDPLDHVTHYAYNGDGQVATVADPANKVWHYDYRLGDLAKVTDPLGNSTSVFHDAVGRPTMVTDPNGAVATVTYDVLNQIRQSTDPLGNTLQYGYDDNGNLHTLTDARSHVITWDYDDSDRLTKTTDPLGKFATVGYNAAGLPNTTISRTGKKTTADYDLLNRPKTLSYGVSGTSSESTVTFGYDTTDRLKTLTDTAAAGPTGFGYDTLDRVTQVTQPSGTTDYTYDVGYRRKTMTVGGQDTVNYSYDDAWDLTGITQGTQAATVTLDGAGRRDHIDLPGGWTQQYGYDDAGQVTGITYKHNGTSKGTLGYTYDPAGQTAAVTGSFASVALPAAISGLVYDNANRLTSRAGTTLTYDDDGNLTNDGTTTYTWNARGQLTQLTRPGLTATFGYDAQGDRSSRTVGGTTRNWLTDGDNPSIETEGSATTSLLSGGTDEWFARTGPNGTRTFLTDLQGSTLALGNPTGALTATYSYDPYGNTTATGTPEGNSTTYTGRDDDGTGLMYYRARYYSPTLQRFISEDPAGLGGGANQYAYAADAPTNNTDPSGNNPIAIGCAAGGAINGLIELGIQKLSGRKNYGALGDAILSGCVTGALDSWLGDLGKFGEGGKCLLSNSFAPDTPVLMADGTRKPIQDITIGDRVRATDPETGRTVAEPVMALIDGNGQKHLVQITVRGNGGKRAKARTVTATDGHPFWEPKRRKWVTAGDLKPGMWLRTSAGTWTQVAAVRTYTRVGHVYNLTVDNEHTYYVFAGDAPVLVHNEEAECPIGIHTPDECTCFRNPFEKKTTLEDLNSTLKGAEGVASDLGAGTLTPHSPDPNSITAPIHDPVSSAGVFLLQLMSWGVKGYRKIRKIGD